MNLEFEFVNHANEIAWNLSEAGGCRGFENLPYKGLLVGPCFGGIREA